jgi:hypothetical protein
VGVRRRRFFIALVGVAVTILAGVTVVAQRDGADAAGELVEAGARPDAIARTATAPARRDERPRHPERVMVWGDSVAVTFEPVVGDALARLRSRIGATTLLRRSALGFGLTSPQVTATDDGRRSEPSFTDWPVRLARTLREDRPDAVVVLIGTWDTLPRFVGERQLDPGTPEWLDWYSDLVEMAAREITATGAHLTWLTHPCVTEPTRNARLPAVNEVYRDVARRVPGVELIDLDAMACPGGAHDPGLRTEDGTHFNDGAPAVLGGALAVHLAVAWGLA